MKNDSSESDRLSLNLHELRRASVPKIVQALHSFHSTTEGFLELSGRTSCIKSTRSSHHEEAQFAVELIFIASVILRLSSDRIIGHPVTFNRRTPVVMPPGTLYIARSLSSSTSNPFDKMCKRMDHLTMEMKNDHASVSFTKYRKK
jgi:hypothetical protein